MSPLISLRAVLAAATLASGSAGAAGSTVEQCVAASDEGQRLQQQGALSAARAQFEICSNASCPGVVQAACTGWLEEVLNATPTLIVVVRLDSADQPQARVLLDGQSWLTELSGRPQPVDPGEHRLTVEVGALSSEQRLVVNLGEKNRRVLFQLTTPIPEPAPSPPPALSRPAPVLPVVLSGISLVGLSLFVGLGLSGRDALDRLTASPCATTHTCDPAAVDSIQRSFAAADVGLAVGLVAAAGAIWRWWRWADAEVELAPAVTPRGAGLSVVGRW